MASLKEILDRIIARMAADSANSAPDLVDDEAELVELDSSDELSRADYEDATVELDSLDELSGADYEDATSPNADLVELDSSDTMSGADYEDDAATSPDADLVELDSSDTPDLDEEDSSEADLDEMDEDEEEIPLEEPQSIIPQFECSECGELFFTWTQLRTHIVSVPFMN